MLFRLPSGGISDTRKTTFKRKIREKLKDYKLRSKANYVKIYSYLLFLALINVIKKAPDRTRCKIEFISEISER